MRLVVRHRRKRGLLSLLGKDRVGLFFFSDWEGQKRPSEAPAISLFPCLSLFFLIVIIFFAFFLFLGGTGGREQGSLIFLTRARPFSPVR